MHDHRALWTEFLTAKATNALLAANAGKIMYHIDGMGGTGTGTEAASYASLRFQPRPGCQRGHHHPSNKLLNRAIAGKIQSMAAEDVVKVVHTAGLQIARDR